MQLKSLKSPCETEFNSKVSRKVAKTDEAAKDTVAPLRPALRIWAERGRPASSLGNRTGHKA
jgi:hypothetical protein